MKTNRLLDSGFLMPMRIIPIFIPNLGCPHRCIFCNEGITAGSFPDKITPEDVRRTVQDHLDRGPGRKGKEACQIAFYGGNFSGIEPASQIELLETAQRYIDAGEIDSVRISTRPDSIEEGTLDLLKRFSVKTVEVGAQSMVDSVLACCGRGHSAEDTRRAIRMLKACGFESGVHLMAGLPGDSPEGFSVSVDEVIALGPDMVRIHPTIVFRDTELSAIYLAGRYQPLDLEEAVLLCRQALQRFRQAGIDVIRLGLQATPEMDETGAVVAGPFHPAFRSLVEGSIFLDMAGSMLRKCGPPREESIAFIVSQRDLSDFRGIGNRNIALLTERFGRSITVRTEHDLGRGMVILESSGDRHYMNRTAWNGNGSI